MTPRSAAERGPRTAAGRALLDEIARHDFTYAGFIDVVKRRLPVIEAEAAAPAPTDADAWQAGYEACWNRLKDAGRLLPSDGATAAVPLDADMERPETLALLFLIADCVVQMAEKASPDAGRRRAQLTRAAEMMDARLSADEEGGT